MKKLYSAGGIVFKKLQVKDEKQNVYWLICQHGAFEHWSFPKGLIGDFIKNETKENTAVREVREETGILGKIINPTPITIQYSFEDDRNKYFKTVYYFLMKHTGGDFSKKDHEMRDVRWANEKQVKELLTYDNDKSAFEKILRIFNDQ